MATLKICSSSLPRSEPAVEPPREPLGRRLEGDCFPYMMYVEASLCPLHTYTCAARLHGDKEARVQGWGISRETARGSGPGPGLQAAPSLWLHEAASAHCPSPGAIAELPLRAGCGEPGRWRSHTGGCGRAEGPISPQVFALCRLSSVPVCHSPCASETQRHHLTSQSALRAYYCAPARSLI